MILAECQIFSKLYILMCSEFREIFKLKSKTIEIYVTVINEQICYFIVM